VFRLPLSGDRKPQSILNSGSSKARLKLSPDGHWIAYQSNESGRYEVYLCSFPALNYKRQVSNGGGVQPLWGKDGKELFYLTLNAKLMAVDVKRDVPPDTSGPKLLFQAPIEGNPVLGQYAATSDGQKFLMLESARAGSGIEQFHIELNWYADLQRKDP